MSPAAFAPPTASTRGGDRVRRVQDAHDQRPALAQHGRDLRSFDVDRLAVGRGLAARSECPGPLERYQELVGDLVHAGGLPVATVGEHRVLHDMASLQLWSFERLERSGRVRTQGDLAAGQVARCAQECEGELVTPTPLVDEHLVLEEPVVEEREAQLSVRHVDEASRYERREPELVRSALGREPAVHDSERALGVGAGDGGREWEVGPESVVPAPVVELDSDPEEGFPVAELEDRADRGGHRLVAAAPATLPVADGVRGERVHGGDEDASPDVARLEDLDGHVVRVLDHAVGVRWRIVVRVAPVAAIDEPVATGGDDAIGRGDRERAVGGIDLHGEVLVRQRATVGARRSRRPGPIDRREAAPTEAGDGGGVEDDLTRRGELLAEPDRRPGLSEREELVAHVVEVDGCLTGPRTRGTRTPTRRVPSPPARRERCAHRRTRDRGSSRGPSAPSGR